MSNNYLIKLLQTRYDAVWNEFHRIIIITRCSIYAYNYRDPMSNNYLIKLLQTRNIFYKKTNK